MTCFLKMLLCEFLADVLQAEVGWAKCHVI